MLNFAIIVSDFNQTITAELLKGAKEELNSNGVLDDSIEIFHVPGAIELPIVAQWCAKQNKFAVIICLGAVIKGESDHYQFVCEQVSVGCQTVMLAHNVPIIFGVLTVQTEEQARERIGGKEGHKGKEAARAAIQMARLAERFAV